jgi:hypothetical protein
MPLHTYLLQKALLNPEHLEQLMPLVQFKKVEKGQILLSKGDWCKHTFFCRKRLVAFLFH